jgi:hypothetical protein
MAVFTAIGASIFGAGTLLATVSAAALQVAAGIAVNYFAAELNGQNEQPSFGIQGELQLGADVSRTVPIGWGLAEPSLVYANYWGQEGKTPNAYLTQVICLADYPVTAFGQLMLDGSYVTPLWNEANEMGAPILEKRGNSDHAWIKFYDGTQTTADPWLVSLFGSHPERPYGADRVGYGCPYVILTTKADETKWNGFPTIKATLYGAKLYDISRDSSRGGVGPQRVDQPATWGGDGDDLVIVQAYNMLNGFRFNGQWLYGLQDLPLARLPDAWWIGQINACRATVIGPAGPEPTYRAGGSIRVSTPVADTIRTLMTACQGRMVEAGGEYRPHVGGVSPTVDHITDGDLQSTEEQRFVPFFGLSNTINGIAGSHLSPENGWNTLPLPTLLRPDLEVADGNRRLLADVALDLVPYNWQAQRLMLQALAEARRERKLTLVLSGDHYLALPGETITFTSEENGFIDKLFRIDGAVDLANGDVIWDITELDPSDYDPDFSAYVPPVVGPLLPAVVPVQTIIGWNVIPDVLSDTNGTPRRPAVRFIWNPDIEDVRSVGMQLRIKSTQELVFSESYDNVTDGQVKVASARIFPNQLLQGRGRYFSSSGTVPQEWSGWLDVLTPNILYGSLDVDLDELAGEIEERVAELMDWSIYNTRETIEAARKNLLLDVDQDAANYRDKQQLRKELTSTFGTAKASWTLDIVTATGPNSALSMRIEELNAVVFDPVSGLPATTAIVDLLSAEVNNTETGLEAIGNAILSITSSVPGAEAAGLFRIYTAATEAGAESTIALTSASSASAGASTAALFLSTIAGGIGEVTVVANRFAVKTSPTGTPYGIFVVDAGVVWMDEARIRNLKAANIDVNELTASAGFFDNFEATWAQIDTAVVNNFVAQSANIANLAVGTLKIAAGAVSTVYSAISASDIAFSSAGGATAGTVNPASLVIPLSEGSLLIEGSATVRLTPLSSSNFARIFLQRNGVVIPGAVSEIRDFGTSRSFVSVTVHDAPGPGTYTYSLMVTGGGDLGQGFNGVYAGAPLIVTNNKR